MTMMITRRRLLASASLAATYALRGNGARAQSASLVRLAAERRTLDVNGKAASIFALRQPDGTAGVLLGPDQRFVVELTNAADASTIIHWHGQTPPVRQDGVTDTGLETLIAPGTSQRYDFAPRPGTHWMHSHHGLQEQRLMAAPLIVRTAEDMRTDVQDVVVLLHDFTFRDPSEILAALTKSAGAAVASGRHDAAMHGMDMGDHAAMATAGATGMPKTGMVMDLNDIDFDAYLANDRTLADPLVVRTERNGRVRLRLINGAASTAFWLDLGALDGTVVAVDGDPVRPISVRRFPMAQAQRVDVVVQMPPGGGAFAVLAQREGDRQRTGFILASPGASIGKIPAIAETKVGPVDMSLERRLQAARPLTARRPDAVHRVSLTGTMMPYRWSIDGRVWAQHQALAVSQGQRVALDIVNRSQMAHPMHLHGHHFQVVALDGQPIAGPMRDTVLVPANGAVQVAFDADNPGRWLFHCHNLYHMATGMMTEVAYTGFA